MHLAKLTLLAVLAATIGCTTSFTGSAHVQNGRAGCEAKCKAQGMAVAGLVYMGEYSSACVCEVPRTTGSVERHILVSSTGGAAGAAASVMMQMREQQSNKGKYQYRAQ